MKNDIISLDNILDEFIKPERKTLKDKFFPNEEILKQKFAKSLRLKDMIKMEGWQTDIKEKITKALRNGFGKLLRPSSLNLSEVEIKAVLAEMQAYLSMISEIVYHMDEGMRAADRLGEMEDAVKNNRR